MGKIIIHVNGLDRIGIISDISKEINKLSGNIETSKMVKLGRDFNMLLLISIKKENIKLLENKLLSYDDLSITLKQTANEKPADNIYLFILKGADNEGIVHMFTQLFSKYNISIIDVETKLLNAPTTGSPLFYMKLILEIPKNILIAEIRRKCHDLEDKNNVAIKISEFNKNINH